MYYVTSGGELIEVLRCIDCGEMVSLLHPAFLAVDMTEITTNQQLITFC